MKSIEAPRHIRTITEYHRLMQLPRPEHPLISVVRFEDIKAQPAVAPKSISHHFYTIALKKNVNSKIRYGQQDFDFDEGVMVFMSPRQILSVESSGEEEFKHTGWLLLIHPDFLWNTTLSGKIKQYEFFCYHLREALHLSEKEEALVVGLMQQIEQEYHANMDASSHHVMIAQLELMLTYAERFYQRQFLTRRISNHTILERMEKLLTHRFKDDILAAEGIPTVESVAEALNLSPDYLSRLLTTLTKQSTRHFIQDKLINLAKEKLSTTDLSVNEIAFQLGFEHPQSFSKLFKNKTRYSPVEFRQSFN
ncbi:helix-turn-helix domain-containing protein [Dyadobacter chenhuakuii]|uniref:Helix-turn-helix transcriptional regulator n=1 Tax=Dyadobacter chenhuakuii TaxID=2909339 RepID=A0ABY4XS84_9BACT|nr:response regulator transcription factor [Dyadobacter chenhuakuii]MCF2492445.1 helix-turn-helix transcriptional regulator [Dyadobacter chenhuakuii]USJ33255.1 helix-turn-helix transcriptional regulator [Dyadobacter chenhuakuii]